MRICKIWDADYPWDIRVEKIVQSLIQAGHSVDLVCRNQARRKRVEGNGRFTIRRLPSFPSIFGPIHTLCNFPFPFNPVWIKAIARAIRDSHADLILVRDLPLALPAVVLGRIFRIPVVFDMAEHYPAMLEDRLRYTPTRLLGTLARHPGTARCIERLTLHLVDHTIVVVEESRDRLLKAGYPSEKLTIVSNTPRLDQWKFENLPRTRVVCNGRLNLVYLGNLDGIRGLDVSIHALSYLRGRGHDIHLTVIGDGPNLPQLRELADRAGVRNEVEFAGRLSIHDDVAMVRIQTIMSQSDIGLIPHYATEACNSTIPNKLFDYMVIGLPVIVSEMKPTARIVQEEECGIVFRDRDPLDLARCVLALADPGVRKYMGAKGQEAIRRRYNWSCDSKVLVEALETVMARGVQVSAS